MPLLSLTSLTAFADAAFAASAMKSFVEPVVGIMCGLASLVCVFFLVNGGIHYMTSAGKPEKLDHAKKVIRNALIGLVIVLGAATMTAILSHAYISSGSPPSEKIPSLAAIQPDHASDGVVELLIKAITGLLLNLVDTAASPFLQALSYFTNSTPLMGDNSSVFNIWLAIVGITDALFVLVVALLGFHVMSYASFGLDEIEFKHLFPQLALVFLLINTSIFVIDSVIALSNAMIHALQTGFPSTSVWLILSTVARQSAGFGLAVLLLMVVLLVLVVVLLVYYVSRLVTLYLGAVLSPLILLLWLLPGFKDFSEAAAKTYMTTIFVLFVHVVILQLASSLLNGLVTNSPDHAPNPMMALVVGVSTVVALLKTQGVLMQLSYASVGPKTVRKLGGQFVNGISHMAKTRKSHNNRPNTVIVRRITK